MTDFGEMDPENKGNLVEKSMIHVQNKVVSL